MNEQGITSTMPKRKEFNVAHIVPLGNFDLVQDRSYHMCLSHLCNDVRYAKFFHDRAREGKFVLMDNGAAEDSQLSNQDLFKLYRVVLPTEVVVPDTVSDSVSTINKARKFIEEFNDNFHSRIFRFMLVPQGSNFTEWIKCCEIMLRKYVADPKGKNGGFYDSVKSIGISKFLNITTSDPLVRYKAVTYLESLFLEYGIELDIHLLGCHEGPAHVRKIQQASEYVRGCDTAFAYIAAQDCELITEKSIRPNGEIDFINGQSYAKTLENIKSFDEVSGVKNPYVEWEDIGVTSV